MLKLHNFILIKLMRSSIIRRIKTMKPFFSFQGKVFKGDKKSRRIQFPTANLKISSEISAGVYAVKTKVGDEIFGSIGYKRKEGNIFEVYIFNFNGNLYGRKIKIDFFKKIREPMEFRNRTKLRQQIEKDCKKAKKILE